MPRYHLSAFPQEANDAPHETEQRMARLSSHHDDLDDAGVQVFSATLTVPESATVVQATERGAALADGPYAQPTAPVSRVTIIEVADFDEALEWAGRNSEATRWPVEVRPLIDERSH